ncbi:hypothetical protein [Acinetobacter beijerinckii]|uniref:Uncharacterized protein n=1 Tax=Acinetobacter beijerinckii CIP 110307 TaxID=1217648 RepID=N9F6P3_9GAMM|nr:hypothetical protein [Acinetobacter beijerinckii]ENW02985.1 hypothetical protein F933_03391 [Acinetobacter beijerinckii CIP 110307]
MNQLNVVDKNQSLKHFFISYSSIEGSLENLNRIELLERLGEFNEGEKEAAESYSPNDIFIAVASAATGIPEHEFLVYALDFFGHNN